MTHETEPVGGDLRSAPALSSEPKSEFEPALAETVEAPHRVGLGIDIGGTGIKAAVIDLDRGTLVGDRARVATPQPATIAALTEVVRELVAPLVTGHSSLEVIGLAFPAVVRRGIALSAVNIANEWMYADVGKAFSDALGHDVWALNDSDAAAYAEARFGAGRHSSGTTVTVTLGTGVGTGLVIDGRLIPNIELGCLTVRGKAAGMRVANSVRKARRLSWRAWAADLQIFVDALDEAVAPDLVVIGGGISVKGHRFVPLIRSRPRVVPARLQNDAGLIGAASYADFQVVTRRTAVEGKITQLIPSASGDATSASDLVTPSGSADKSRELASP